MGEEYAFDDSNIMSFISKLRKKIEPNPEQRFISRLSGVWGIGSIRRHEHGAEHLSAAGLLIALLVIAYLLAKLHRVRGQLSLIKDALTDIKNGNLNRRVLARESDLTKQICYDINEIAMSSQSRLIQQKQSEQAYKRLMTSLSHDVKTPLASLVGYLEAVESKIVTGPSRKNIFGWLRKKPIT